MLKLEELGINHLYILLFDAVQPTCNAISVHWRIQGFLMGGRGGEIVCIFYGGYVCQVTKLKQLIFSQGACTLVPWIRHWKFGHSIVTVCCLCSYFTIVLYEYIGYSGWEVRLEFLKPFLMMKISKILSLILNDLEKTFFIMFFPFPSFSIESQFTRIRLLNLKLVEFSQLERWRHRSNQIF